MNTQGQRFLVLPYQKNNVMLLNVFKCDENSAIVAYILSYNALICRAMLSQL